MRDFVTKKSLFSIRLIINVWKSLGDTAERAVALTEDFYLLLTKDEDQRQYLLEPINFHVILYLTFQKEKLASLP